MIIIIAAALVVVEPGRVDPSRSVKSDASSSASSNSDTPGVVEKSSSDDPQSSAMSSSDTSLSSSQSPGVTQLRFGVMLCRRLESGTVTFRHVPEVSV
ncbi:hypothetical protein MTO96_023963 [Rhipicephalus appendiculatus]